MTGREEYDENNAGRSIGSSRNRKVTEAETAASTAEFSAEINATRCSGTSQAVSLLNVMISEFHRHPPLNFCRVSFSATSLTMHTRHSSSSDVMDSQQKMKEKDK
ncbi:hypothetical protein D5086_014102 [Populus alba]|uniref:Uncharacterized protein n=1 Tax=Populus alba TaxID=43335 RepID=A0ACC4C7E8_POPAL